jgi:hypothetical protein
MPITSRRDVILSAAVAGAALGLDKSLAIVAPVEGQQAPVRSQHKPTAPVRRAQTPDPKPGFLRYKVGDAEITALHDGIWEKVHDPAYFSNATVAETKQALVDAGLTAAFVPIPITVSSPSCKASSFYAMPEAATRCRPSIQILFSFPAR